MCWVACDRLARIATRLGLTDRALYWLSVGAQPSEAVARLLKSKGVYAALEASRAGAAG